MFDLGWFELFVVAMVAVVVVGPKDLPKVMRLVGQWTGKARAMADQFRRSFDDMARQAELEDMRSEVMKLHNETSLAEIQRETDIMLGHLPPDPVTPLKSNPKDGAPGPAVPAPTAAPAATAAAAPSPPLSVGGSTPSPAAPGRPPDASPPAAAQPPRQHRDEP